MSGFSMLPSLGVAGSLTPEGKAYTIESQDARTAPGETQDQGRNGRCSIKCDADSNQKQGRPCLTGAFELRHRPVSDPSSRYHHAIGQSPFSAPPGRCRSTLALGETEPPSRRLRRQTRDLRSRAACEHDLKSRVPMGQGRVPGPALGRREARDNGRLSKATGSACGSGSGAGARPGRAVHGGRLRTGSSCRRRRPPGCRPRRPGYGWPGGPGTSGRG